MIRHPLEHGWELLCCAVDKMSVAKTVTLGGTGSALSLATASAPDFTTLNAYLHTAALGAGTLGAVLSVGLVVLKAWLEIKRHAREELDLERNGPKRHHTKGHRPKGPDPKGHRPKGQQPPNRRPAR